MAQEKKQKMILPSLDDFFSTEESRIEASLEKVQDISISLIDDFKNHPFKVIENEELNKMVDSIIEKGVLVPAIIRPKENGRYEMISGHRRKRASQLAEKDTIPCIIRDLSDDEATIVMVDSNIHREEILPSEKAFAYKMKLEAISHQGKSTSRQVGEKLLSVDLLGEEQGDSGRQVQRFIRLTNLNSELLELVDKGRIAFNPAVELSYLKKEEQVALLDYIQFYDSTPSHAQAIRLKELSQKGNLNSDIIGEIMGEVKPNQASKIKLDEKRLKSVLPKNISGENVEDYVVKAIDFYTKYLFRQHQKPEEKVRWGSTLYQNPFLQTTLNTNYLFTNWNNII